MITILFFISIHPFHISFRLIDGVVFLIHRIPDFLMGRYHIGFPEGYSFVIWFLGLFLSAFHGEPACIRRIISLY
ncbi:hypothetical protein HMPREF1548_00712 [Clostridium sp. KLE 1755]|uniref:Uncharacterized protein n=1 Tax=Eisenbergiella massiliensis TaxID=1720294 RepID=A0A3E3I1L3_9FIRM|nr:hypothetical protein HMPREF1548_00712 [Clostridium sp. KLE 1755]RGE58442.1 hypothetical protein DWY69_31100 [Eisenbergiella massiliensis]